MLSIAVISCIAIGAADALARPGAAFVRPRAAVPLRVVATVAGDVSVTAAKTPTSEAEARPGAAFVRARAAVPRPALRMVATVAGDMSVTAAKTPKATFEAMVDKGVSNAKMSVGKVLFSSITGGCFVGFGGLLSVAITGAMPGVAAANPGLIRFVFAALFPVNLLLVLQTGAQLFTGNTATVSSAYVEGKVSLGALLRSWTLSFVGNVIGCGLIALAASYTGILSGGAAEVAAATVIKKCSMGFGPTFVKAVLCNWLVCLAVFLATQAQGLGGKMVGIWFPISTFVAIGFEHSVANMFLLPLGLLAGAKIGVAGTIVRNLIPVTLGNAFAGAVIVGAGFSYLHGSLAAEEGDGSPSGGAAYALGCLALATVSSFVTAVRCGF